MNLVRHSKINALKPDSETEPQLTVLLKVFSLVGVSHGPLTRLFVVRRILRRKSPAASKNVEDCSKVCIILHIQRVAKLSGAHEWRKLWLRLMKPREQAANA